MKSYHRILGAIFASVFLAVAAFAADANPSGTWKWTVQGRNGGPGLERKATLDYKDGKLTGTILAAKMGNFEIPATEIADGSFKDGKISFSVTNEFNGNKRTTKYDGALEGDTIKGSTERPGRDGGTQKSEWLATREK